MTTVAIVGRPNVGKSTLFNRLLSKRISIVDRISGVTRDRLYGEVNWSGRRITIIDTGGVDFDKKDLLRQKVLEQIKISIKEADWIIFLTDAKDGVVPLDKEISRVLHSSGKKVIVAVNKVDNEKLEEDVYSFSELGWDKITSVSALHGLKINQLLDMIVQEMPAEEEKAEEKTALKTAIIGKPNVGKSTFVNAVLNQTRMIVDEQPGTTRDAVDIKFSRNGNPWIFIDTAGVRKRKKIRSPLEFYSVNRAYLSIDRADAVILMIDGWQGITKQDAQLVDYIIEKEKPCVIAVNKWDLVKGVDKKSYRDRITNRLAEHWYVPSVFISSLKKENIDKVLDKTEDLARQSCTKVPTKLLNKLFHSLETVRSLRIYYGTQIKTNPPEFLLFVNAMPDRNSVNYIKNKIHEVFELEVPIHLRFRPKKK